MISANGGLPAHRYTPKVTQRWPRGSEPASLRCCWCLVLWRVPVCCGVSLGVLRCGGAALVCRGVLLYRALSCGVLRPVLCPAVLCCLAVLCWWAVLCGSLRCWCLFFLLSSFRLPNTPVVFPCL